MGKTYVKVFAEHDENGKTKPLALTWTDGKQYGIDRVADLRLTPLTQGRRPGHEVYVQDTGERSLSVRGRREMVLGEVIYEAGMQQSRMIGTQYRLTPPMPPKNYK